MIRKGRRFWKILCVLTVAALFYIGHGLHKQPSHGALPFESAACAV